MRKIILITGLIILGLFVYSQNEIKIQDSKIAIEDPIPLSFWSYGTGGIYYNGNVGIGTTSPSQKLHVYGDSYLQGKVYIGNTDTYFFRDVANRIKTDDMFYVGTSSPATYLYSANTYLGASSGDKIHLRSNIFDWTSGGGGIINSSGNVGIGTISPIQKLQVEGNIRLLNEGGYIQKVKGLYFTWASSYGTQFNHGIFSTDGTTYSDDITLNSYGNVRINFDSNNNGTNTFTIGNNTTGLSNTLFTLKEDGKVGIGTITPSKRLDVNGDINLSGNLYQNGSLISLEASNKLQPTWDQEVYNQYFTYNPIAICLNDPVPSGYGLLVGNGALINGNLGVGTNNPIKKLDVKGDINFTGDLYKNGELFDIFWAESGEDIWYNGGNVAIGPVLPTAKLEVLGKIKANHNRPITIDPMDGYIRIKASGDSWFLGTQFESSGGIRYDGWGAVGNEDNLDYYYVGIRYDNPFMAIKSNGNIGIGTSNPASTLDVIDDDAKFKLTSTGNESPTIKLIGNDQEEGIGNIEFLYNGTEADSYPDALIRAQQQYGTNYTELTFFTRGASGLLPMMAITDNSGIRIGASSIPSGYKLAVDGKIICEELTVKLSEDWADFVFEANYNLMSLKNLESFIQENKHLPEIPTTIEVEEKGISVGEMNAKLLQKVEELTLYTIQQEDKINNQQEVINELLKRVEQLENK